MASLKSIFAALLLLSACLSAAEPSGIEIKNDLQQCATLTDRGLTYTGEIPVLKMTVKVLAETSVCGCKSALSKYSVYQMREGYEACFPAE